MSGRIVVAGPTGNTGQEVVKALAARGLDVVGMVRSEKNRERLRALGIASVHGDFADKESLSRALEGAEKASTSSARPTRGSSRTRPPSSRPRWARASSTS